MRRFAMAGTPEDYAACVRLLRLAPDAAARAPLLAGFEQAFEGRSLPTLPGELVDALVRSGGASLSLRIRQGDPAALAEAARVLGDDAAPAVERIRLVTTFGEVPHAPVAAELRRLVAGPASELRAAALAAAAAYDDAGLTDALLVSFPGYTPAEQAVALSVLASRRASATALLDAVADGRFARTAVPAEMQDRLRMVEGGALAARVDEVFGGRREAMPESMEREIARIAEALRGGRGNPYPGRELYAQRCYACHKLHGRGGEIGPDLTSFKRDDTESLALAIVNPNAEIREGYESFVLSTKAGATHAGFLVQQDTDRVVLRDMAGISVPVERAAIDSLVGMGRSLMPEGLTDDLTVEQIRDLFAYMRITQPLVGQDDPSIRSD
jgi:putative heme-binding domain-containing protein